MSEEPKRRRGRPPGAKNKARPGRPKLPRKSARVEARKREVKTRKPKAAAKLPVHEVQAEIVLPGEEFGSRLPPDDDEGSASAQMAFVWPRPRGRPPGSGALLHPTEATLDRIWTVGTHQGTQHDLAIRLGVSLKTVQRFFEDYPEARDVFDDARAAGIGSLRAHLYRESLSGNTSALLHAAKHWLGMSDRYVVSSDSAGGPEEPKKLQRIVIELVDAKDPAS
jgi:hypothetical protein